MPVKITVLAGGVGGAKLVDGLAHLLSPESLGIIVNTADDFEYLGLKISPDLDTVCYTLADLANLETGWGLRDETWVTFDTLSKLGGLDWFRLGDKDLATHLFRTRELDQGRRLSDVTRDLCNSWGVQHPVYPMSDEPVRTIVHTVEGELLGFQEYFVQQACQPVVESFEFKGSDSANPVSAALQAIESSDLVILAPSNPWVSIAPILAVAGYLEAISRKPVVAVSPIIGGKALKGPAAKMYWELGIQPSASSVANHYREFLTGFVFDSIDRDELEKIKRWRIIPLVTDIVMRDKQDRIRLAEEILEFSETILNRSR
jgi:LPPG:FO 2-phospho-L-lactate transferase